MTTRIGQGYDVHAFEIPLSGSQPIPLVLGGVQIPFDRGLIAHSDGDVLIHALVDALLGAMALGDIGHHFPDNDPQYRNADSREMLRKVVQIMRERSFRLGNADITLIAQAPKMAPYIPGMIDNLAADVVCKTNQINIKATTTEKLGFVGREEGIACQAVVLILSG